MADILADYREWRDAQPTRVSTHSGGCHMWHKDCMIHRLADALGRARLTDEEREAISRVYDLLCDRARELQSATRLDEARPLIQWAKTLQGLWERLSGTAAISGAGKSAPAANTPPELTDEERHAIAVVRNCAMTRAERFLTQSDAEREATLVLWRLRERLG